MNSHSSTRMPRRRLWIANMVILLVVMPSLYCIVRDREYWPYSSYPMYSGMAGTTRNEVAAFAVPADASATEFKLRETRQIHPFDRQRLFPAARRVMWALDQDGDTARLDAALTDIYTRYEARRVQGLHDGPPIRAVRIYQQLWDEIDPRLNVIPPPDRRRLVGESRAELWSGQE